MKNRRLGDDVVDFRQWLGVVDGVDVPGPVLLSIGGDARLPFRNPFATLVLVVVRLFAISAEDLVAIVVAVVARTPVGVVLCVVVRAHWMWLLTLIARVGVAVVVGFEVPVVALSLRPELDCVNVRFIFFNGRNRFVRIRNLDLISSNFECLSERGGLLLRDHSM